MNDASPDIMESYNIGWLRWFVPGTGIARRMELPPGICGISLGCSLPCSREADGVERLIRHLLTWLNLPCQEIIVDYYDPYEVSSVPDGWEDLSAPPPPLTDSFLQMRYWMGEGAPKETARAPSVEAMIQELCFDGGYIAGDDFTIVIDNLVLVPVFYDDFGADIFFRSADWDRLGCGEWMDAFVYYDSYRHLSPHEDPPLSWGRLWRSLTGWLHPFRPVPEAPAPEADPLWNPADFVLKPRITGDGPPCFPPRGFLVAGVLGRTSPPPDPHRFVPSEVSGMALARAGEAAPGRPGAVKALLEAILAPLTFSGEEIIVDIRIPWERTAGFEYDPPHPRLRFDPIDFLTVCRFHFLPDHRIWTLRFPGLPALLEWLGEPGVEAAFLAGSCGLCVDDCLAIPRITPEGIAHLFYLRETADRLGIPDLWRVAQWRDPYPPDWTQLGPTPAAEPDYLPRIKRLSDKC